MHPNIENKVAVVTGATRGIGYRIAERLLDEGAKVGESKFGLPLVNLADIKLGEEKTAEVELEAGRYELSCLVVEEIGGKATNHYGEGMFALLEVE